MVESVPRGPIAEFRGPIAELLFPQVSWYGLAEG